MLIKLEDKISNISSRKRYQNMFDKDMCYNTIGQIIKGDIKNYEYDI